MHTLASLLGDDGDSRGGSHGIESTGHAGGRRPTAPHRGRVAGEREDAPPRAADVCTRPARRRLTALLEARGIVKRYGHVTAHDGADFEVSAGEVVAMIGD